MQQRRLVYALARVWRGVEGGAPQLVGSALLVSTRHLLSCAHVVNASLGLAYDAPDRPEGLIWLDFPASAPGVYRAAHVGVWYPRRARPGGLYDIAGLELREEAPPGALPAPLVRELPSGEACRIFGFPAGRPDGNYADGTLGDTLANGWVMLRGGSEAREFVRPGYSGGPVYTAQGVVGIVSEGERDARVREAVMIPAQTLLSAWPELYRLGRDNPYRGLASFGEGHAHIFFGREREVETLRGHLERPGTLTLLAGASGSGKSSLIAAGLLPALSAEGWCTVYTRPGSAPFRALARALLPLWKPELTGVAALAEQGALARRLESGDLSLAEVLSELCVDTEGGAPLLLVLDQAEELLTQGADAARVIGELLSLLAHPETRTRLRLLLGIRTDFLDRLSALGLPHTLPDHTLMYLGGVSDLRAVIEQPLEGGLSSLEPGLSDRLVAEVSGEANPLPLLEFTLSELWRAQRHGRLTHAAYDALGGASQAIARHAQAIFETLSDDEQRQAERLFTQLMHPTENGLSTRRVASFAELGEGSEGLLKRLSDHHLIVTGRDPARPDTAEVVHEALFEHWPLLRLWGDRHRRFRRWQEGLRDARRDWLAAERHPDYLPQGARLAAAEGYLSTHAEWLSADEVGYIRLGLEREARRAQEQTAVLAAQARRRQRLNYALSSLLLVALTLSGLAGWQWQRAEAQAQLTEALNTRLLATNRTLQRTAAQVQRNARSALAHKLSAQGLLATRSPGPLSGDPRLGALLTTEATRRDDNTQSRGNLLRALQSELVLHSDGEQLSALSRDGRTLALTNGGALSLWNTQTRAQTLELAPSSTLYLSSLAFSPDGGQLVAADLGGALKLWEVATGLEVAAPQRDLHYPTAFVDFGENGQLLVTTLDARLEVWTPRRGGGWRLRLALSRAARPPSPAPTALPSGATTVPATAPLPIRRPPVLTPRDEHLLWLRGAALSPDGEAAALIDTRGEVSLVSLVGSATGSPRRPARFVPTDAARSLAFSPDGTLAVGDREGRVTLWNPRSGAQTPLFTLGSAVSRLAFSSNTGSNTQLLAAAEASGRVSLWSLSEASRVTALPLAFDTVHQLVFDGTTLLIRAREGPRTALYAVDTASFTPVVRRNLRVTWQRQGELALWDVRGSDTLSTPLLHGVDSFAQQLRYSPDGRLLALRSNNKTVYLFDAHSHALLAGPLRAQEDIESLAFSPDSQTLATGTREGEVALREARTGRVRRRLGPYRRALALAFHPDGRRLALGTEGDVEVIDLESGEITTPEWDIPTLARQELISTLAYSPDGTRLLAGYGTLIYVWDAHTLEPLAPPLAGVAGDRMVRQLHLSPDGRWLLAAYNDGWTAGIWELGSLRLQRTLTGVSGAAFGDGLLATGGLGGAGSSTLTLWNARTLEPLSDPVSAHGGEAVALAFNPAGTVLVSSATDNSVRFWRTSLVSWQEAACRRAERNLSGEEWRAFMGALPYRKTCAEHPVDASALELLLTQAEAASSRGEAQHAATLLGRARRYALESPELTETICAHPSGEQLGCAEAGLR